MDFDRMKHSLAVARKMVEIGKNLELDEEQIQELFLLGFNHDIGYEFGINENHNIIGGTILKNSGYNFWQEVYYHGNPEADYNSLYLDILNEADMKINKYGEVVGYEKRLSDIRSRYGSDSVQYNNALKIIDYLENRRRL